MFKTDYDFANDALLVMLIALAAITATCIGIVLAVLA